MVWRLVLSLFLHLTLLLLLAIYLELALNSVRRYSPVTNPEQLELASLDIIPALLDAMDTERRAYQKTGDPGDLDTYQHIRKTTLANLDSLNLPTLLISEQENQRRTLTRQWISTIGDLSVGAARPGTSSASTDTVNASSRTLIDQVRHITENVRLEVNTTLRGIQNQEEGDAASLVNFMWIGVGFVTVITIIFQLFVSNSIIAPIQTLTGVVRRLQNGDYSARARIRSGDEIQNLGETFNSLAENIQHNQRELEDKNKRLSDQQEALRLANAGLEGRVAEKTRELEDKNQKLNEAARLKDEFLATLSHELRTPLTPIISCAHLLGADPTLDSAQLKNVQVIDRNARALSRMIDELLDLSAVMNNKLRLEREKTEMNDWTRATLETLRPAWEKKQLTLTFTPETHPVELEIDPTRLAQVLTNLVTNAIKYTDSGGKITVRLRSLQDEIRISVKDTGAGLERHEIDRIFEMFQQARTPHTQSVSGLGVGLTVARSVAELHGGGLLADSPGPGKGATFTLWLPHTNAARIDPPAPVAPPPPAKIDRQLLRGRRILLVEDSEDTRDALQRIFLRRQCRVAASSNAEEALSLAENEMPEIVISDLGLPGLSGFEFMKRIRAMPGGSDLIALAFSGLGRDQDIHGAMEAGFDAHLLKPVDIATIDQALISALQKKAAANDNPPPRAMPNGT